MSGYWDRDIVERLRSRAEYAKQEKTGTADGDAVHLNQAADEIALLRSQVERMRGALKPFDDMPDWPGRDGSHMTDMRISYRELRAAHEALRALSSTESTIE